MTGAPAGLLVLLLVAAGPVRGSVEAAGIALAPEAGGYALQADFQIDLPSPLEDALSNGVPLHFVVEFELKRPRTYWFAEKIAASALALRLTYLPLSERYQVSAAAGQRSFRSLGTALRELGRVRGWRVLGENQVKPGSRYTGRVRLRLDTAQLPGAFHMRAVTDSDWTLESAWERFAFSPREPGRP